MATRITGIARKISLLPAVVYTLIPQILHAEHIYSDSLLGPLGLNTIPNARMDKTGTAKIGVSTLDPYVHGYIGFQLAEPLYINIRQTAEVSNINADPDRLYPGIDFKLRLLKENRSRPAIALGLQSAIGHKRMAGEYLALSKRYKDFDFTAGLGWGRFAGAAHLSNPLKALSSHFGKARSLDGEMPNEPKDWFTGEHIGLFGGVEYFTPIDGLSAKFDIGGDRYEAEKAALNYNAPAPWSIGLSYSPTSWINAQIALQGTDKIMGRLSLKNLIQNWRDKDAQDSAKKTKPFNPYRSSPTSPNQMETDAQSENILLTGLNTDELSANAKLLLNQDSPAPYQIGQAVKHIANHAGTDIESIELIPTRLGLHGPKVKLLRADFEKAALDQGSPEEIWQNAEFDTAIRQPFRKLNRNHESFFGLQAFYDIPYLDITAQAKAGRFLAEDIGGQLSLSKTFKNGAKLEGFVSITDQADYDLFGGTTHAYNGVKLTLPLGGFKYMPRNSEIRTIISPMGRDIGQSINNPLPLYALTESFSYTHLEQHWDKIVSQ